MSRWKRDSTDLSLIAFRFSFAFFNFLVAACTLAPSIVVRDFDNVVFHSFVVS